MQDELKRQIATVADAIIAVESQPVPALGLDLDGCCDESEFFQILSHVWPGPVIVITFRSDRSKAEADLERLRIKYTDLVLVNSMEAKAAVIAEKNVAFYIDDQPETLKNVASNVGVLLFRNGGNFDEDDRRWMFSDRTGKLV